MSADLDRLDRVELGIKPPSPPVVRAIAPVTRGPKFVDAMTCPMCNVERLGITYQGELMSGAKVHELAAHSAGRRSVANGQPRCLGARMRVVFENGIWKGAPQ